MQAALFSAAPTQEGSVVLAVELSGFSIFSFSFFFRLSRGNVPGRGVGFGNGG